MAQNNPADQQDRRNYFRIDDVTILYHRLISDAEQRDAVQSDKTSIDRLTLKARFESLSRKMQPLEKNIKQDNPNLARYLDAIDQKLNMLSEILLDSALDELDEVPQQVNISAGGLAFLSETPITPGSIMELRIVLLPSNVGIYSHARVVSCKKDSGESGNRKDYRVSVEFVHMDDEFRDMISRHVLKREQAALMAGHALK